MGMLGKFLISFSSLVAVLIFGYISISAGTDLEKISNARLIDNPDNDGDSFHIYTGTTRLHIRLYYVDCPEVLFSSKSDVQRLREQTRYFGLSSAERTVHFGRQAKTFVEQHLSEPFTVHTAYANALGRSSEGRIYGFITTAAGDDLATLLVSNGLARRYGVGRRTPDDVPREEMVEKLRDLEISAMLKRKGIWAESDPDRIAGMRALQRQEDRALQQVRSEIEDAGASQMLLDLNTASQEAIEAIKGISPILARRIVAGRPYKTVDDLLRIKGIGHKKFQELRPHFTTARKE